MKEDYKEPLGTTSDGSTNVDLKSEQVERGQRLVLQRIAAVDETTDFTTLRFGVEKLGGVDWFSHQGSPSADRYYWEKSGIPHLIENERLVVRFTGTTDGDQLRANLFGYKEISNPGLPKKGTGLETGRAEERRAGSPRTEAERAERHGELS